VYRARLVARYPRTIKAMGSLQVKSAYLDGELCALNGEGVPVFIRRGGLVGKLRAATSVTSSAVA
jgi:hypothetical protein